jgi:hypothetical protein
MRTPWELFEGLSGNTKIGKENTKTALKSTLELFSTLKKSKFKLWLKLERNCRLFIYKVGIIELGTLGLREFDLVLGICGF